MNILITGANGQLGNEMRVLSKENGQHAYFFTDVQELDICDEQAVHGFVKDNRIDALIQVSTDYVFDGTGHTPYTEEAATCPNSVYGFTKLAGEQAVMKYCSRAMIIRTAWLYSIYGNNFVKTMLRLGRERETLGVVFDQIGTPTYANDLARVIFAAVNRGIVPGIYHFSNEGVCSWYDFTLAIHRLAGIKSCKVSPLHTDEFPAKAPRPHYSVLDKTKIKKTFGIDIPHWEASLAVCMKNLEE